MTQEGFKRDVLSLKHKLYRFALRILNNADEAEDIVQEVMIRCWKYREKLESYRSIEAFAMTVTRNLCLDHLKSGKNRQTELRDTGISALPDPLKQAELNDAVQLVGKIMDTLPLSQKMILQLRDVEGYEFDEISKILDLTTDNVRVQLSRARKRIREVLSEKYSYERLGI
ncbi:MAG: RNA polymerase sigma factor [Bacteroidales bacterium]|nr:RNA polymerase sigma factor [Bacteroidales bacterium]